jgi:hypothetical protein
MRLVQRARIVSSLPNMASGMMTCIPIGGIPPVSVLQCQSQNISLMRQRDKVYMIRHQAVADQVYPVQDKALP